jgi:2EXR family
MVSLHGLGLISQSFDLFPKLPVELQINIWEAALLDREGRVIFPVLECVSAPHLPPMSNANCEYNRAEVCRWRLSFAC